VGGAVGAVKRSSRAWSQTGIALGQVALHEGDHPPPGDPVVAGNLTFIASFDQHGRDHQLRHSHRSTLVVGCKRCPETAVNDVVNSRTPSPTVMSRDIVHMCLGTSFTVWLVVGARCDGCGAAEGS